MATPDLAKPIEEYDTEQAENFEENTPSSAPTKKDVSRKISGGRQPTYFISATALRPHGSSCLYVNIRLDGHAACGLIDSGSEKSVVNFQYLTERGLDSIFKLTTEGIPRLVGACGEPLRVRGAALLLLEIAGRTVAHSCIAVNNLNADFIIGLDFLKEHKAALDIANEKLILQAKGPIPVVAHLEHDTPGKSLQAFDVNTITMKEPSCPTTSELTKEDFFADESDTDEACAEHDDKLYQGLNDIMSPHLIQGTFARLTEQLESGEESSDAKLEALDPKALLEGMRQNIGVTGAAYKAETGNSESDIEEPDVPRTLCNECGGTDDSLIEMPVEDSGQRPIMERAVQIRELQSEEGCGGIHNFTKKQQQDNLIRQIADAVGKIDGIGATSEGENSAAAEASTYPISNPGEYCTFKLRFKGHNSEYTARAGEDDSQIALITGVTPAQQAEGLSAPEDRRKLLDVAATEVRREQAFESHFGPLNRCINDGALDESGSGTERLATNARIHFVDAHGVLHRVAWDRPSRTRNRNIHYLANLQKHLAVPRKYRPTRLSQLHDSPVSVQAGHDKMYRLSQFMQPRMYSDMRAYVTSCLTCQHASKPERKIKGK